MSQQQYSKNDTLNTFQLTPSVARDRPIIIIILQYHSRTVLVVVTDSDSNT